MAEAAQPNATPASARVDPYPSYNFKLQVQGVTEGHFAECTGMGASVQVIPYRQGGGGATVMKLPGRVEYTDVTLRYGLTKSLELWNWFQSSVKGKVERRNVSVLLLDTDGATEVMRWDLINAWLSAWRGAPLDALGREVAIETLTLVFESLERR